MKMTPELSAIKNAYMKARSNKDTREMSRLKSKAMAIKSQQSSKTEEKLGLLGKKDTKVTMNQDGDSLEISPAAHNIEKTSLKKSTD